MLIELVDHVGHRQQTLVDVAAFCQPLSRRVGLTCFLGARKIYQILPDTRRYNDPTADRPCEGPGP